MECLHKDSAPKVLAKFTGQVNEETARKYIEEQEECSRIEGLEASFKELSQNKMYYFNPRIILFQDSFGPDVSISILLIISSSAFNPVWYAFVSTTHLTFRPFSVVVDEIKFTIVLMSISGFPVQFFVI